MKRRIMYFPQGLYTGSPACSNQGFNLTVSIGIRLNIELELSFCLYGTFVILLGIQTVYGAQDLYFTQKYKKNSFLHRIVSVAIQIRLA